MLEHLQVELERALTQDSALVYLLFAALGVVASFSPCTYPALPLTVGYLGNMGAQKRSRVVFLSSVLVLGMALVFAVFGMIVVAAGGQIGSLLGNGWVLFAIALFFLTMGLMLLEAIPFPRFGLLNRLAARGQKEGRERGGVIGAFLTGCVSGLVVGACTGPFLGVALGFMATTVQEAGTGASYARAILAGGLKLFLFGLGQGTLIFLCCLFAGFLAALPKPGAWMDHLKKGFALLVILGSALLFVYVGQNTDFPPLSQWLAGAEAPAAQHEPAKPPEIGKSHQDGASRYGGDDFLKPSR